MRPVEAARWEDLALAVLLLATSVPRVLLAVMYERPIGAEGALAMVAAALGVLILLYRHARRRG